MGIMIRERESDNRQPQKKLKGGKSIVHLILVVPLSQLTYNT
jgi:hypothetical protein